MAGLTKTSLLYRSKASFAIVPSRCLSYRTPPRQASFAPSHESSDTFSLSGKSHISHTPPPMPREAPLSILPTSSIIRSLAITSISSSPILLAPSLAITNKLAHATSPILNPDTNPVLRFFLKHTFYRQFCAGENAAEVKRTVDGLKSLGFKGVVLGYAREVVLDKSQADNLESCGEYEIAEECIRKEITPWRKGTLETVEMTVPGDFVALKFTGAGSQALYDLSRNATPSPALKEAIDAVCDLAASRGVKLLFDAEQQAVQAGIDSWALEYMRKYNHRTPGQAVVYNTYQAYLKATPSILASHLAVAQREGFTCGVKLVRGAYLGSDPRHLIHDSKADTDNAYDGISASLARRQYSSILKPAQGETAFPEVNLVLAGHNINSVRKIQALRTEQAEKGEKQIDLIYAQLQGMADEVSCELVQAGLLNQGKRNVDIPKAYKYLVWGTTGECMKYLGRRAQENQESMKRTKEGRDAMASELMKRVKKVFGLPA